jgi:hypothetical protein
MSTRKEPLLLPAHIGTYAPPGEPNLLPVVGGGYLSKASPSYLTLSLSQSIVMSPPPDRTE